MEAHPLPNYEGVTNVTALVDNWISRFAVPQELHSDQGSSESKAFGEVAKLLGLRKTWAVVRWNG